MKVHLLLKNYCVDNKILEVDKKTGENWIDNFVAVKKIKKARKKKMIYYSQYDKKWANYPYPSKNHPQATIQTSGCGTTSAAMIVANLSNKLITPLVMAKYALENGFRELEGTSETLFPAIAKKYNLEYSESNDLKNLIKALKNGKIAVCLMNNWFKPGSGHYVVAYKMIGSLIKIKDPASTINNAKLFSQSTFKNKGSNYFIFNKKPIKDEYLEALAELDKLEILDRKYWAGKRKIDKYFTDLIQKIAKYVGKENKK
jgi:hypothetical protein